MVFVVTFLVEALATELAYPRLVPLVDAHVGIEGGAPVKGLVACGTFMGFFRSVDDLVPTKGARLTEPLSANLADERPRPRVDGHVTGQVIMCIEHLATLGASE